MWRRYSCAALCLIAPLHKIIRWGDNAQARSQKWVSAPHAVLREVGVKYSVPSRSCGPPQ